MSSVYLLTSSLASMDRLGFWAWGSGFRGHAAISDCTSVNMRNECLPHASGYCPHPVTVYTWANMKGCSHNSNAIQLLLRGGSIQPRTLFTKSETVRCKVSYSMDLLDELMWQGHSSETAHKPRS